MKPTFRTSYLFQDGHAVVIYEKPDKHAGKVEWCEIIQKLGPVCLFTGRIVIPTLALFELTRKALHVRAKPPEINMGSANTKRLGIPVGYVRLQMIRDQYDGDVTFQLMPSIISAPFTVQPENAEPFDPNARYWGGSRVHKIHLVKQQPQPQPAAVAA